MKLSNQSHYDYFLLILLAFTFISPLAQSKDSDPFGINIPVRLGLGAGYNQGSVSFNADKKDIANNNFLLVFDFNVPIPPIKSMVGINLWFIPSAKTGTTTLTSSLFAGPYIGFSKGKVDILLGAGIQGVSSTIKDEDALPDSQVSLSKSMGCGFAGIRGYFGKSQNAGVGITGYTCFASDYSKYLNSQPDTKTTISDKSSSSGGFLYFFGAWGEERKLI